MEEAAEGERCGLRLFFRRWSRESCAYGGGIRPPLHQGKEMDILGLGIEIFCCISLLEYSFDCSLFASCEAILWLRFHIYRGCDMCSVECIWI